MRSMTQRVVARIITLSLLVILASGLSNAQESDRYLIIHVDAISYETYERALAEGKLPTFERIFAGGVTRRALTLFPGSTPVIYSRLRTGEANDAGSAIGIGGWWDRENDEIYPELRVRSELVFSVPRRAQTGFVYGWVAFTLAELSVMNLPALLERYRVVEFFWYATDTIGHLEGIDAQINSLSRLDAAIGRILPRLDLDDLNLIIYSDHGLSASDEPVNVSQAIDDNLGSNVKYASYPNIYLYDTSQTAEAARRLGEGAHLDFVVYRVEPHTVAGYLYGAYFEVHEHDGAYAYASRDDPFDYAAVGYDGSPLDADEWLALTVAHPYPGAIPNLYRYAQHPNAGELVFGLNPPRGPAGFPQFVGHHYGVRDTDLLVPVWVRGPDLEHLLVDDPLWLHELLQGIEPARLEPVHTREEHRIGVAFDPRTPDAQLRVQYSPAYRWRIDGEASTSGRLNGGIDYDLFSDYLFRLWLGADLTLEQGGVTPGLRAAFDIDLGPLRITPTLHVDLNRVELGIGAEFAFDVANGRLYLTRPSREQWGVAAAW